ncbi:MAG TPA: TldD/PmbA family protein [Bacteriovoracaceae bacterium]|nr:TldD/PmbA family protein [Bacteriovoracaceae bacterium]
MQLIQSAIAQDIIHEGLSLGADFVDVFIERTQNEGLVFKNSRAEDIQSGTIFGIGIRLISGVEALYGYTNSIDREELLRITRLLGARIGKTSPDPGTVNCEKLIYPKVPTILDRNVDAKYRLSFLKGIDTQLRADAKVSQVVLNFSKINQLIEVYDSHGLYASEVRPYIRLFHQVVMKDGNLQSTAFHGPGAIGGWEFMETLGTQEICQSLLKQASTTLYASPCPAGKMPVIIDNAFGGVIFHEACGHLLETTSVEKKASVFWDKLGEKIAHSSLSATDDGTIAGEWGSLSIDDEGMPTQKTKLIENGILKNFISDRLGEIKTGHKRTGSARRQSYKYAPASRMRNTYIEKGSHDLDQMFASVPYGLYAKKMGGGSVDPSTGQFNFSVQEGYIIRDGKITTPVKGATLIGKGPEVMTQISMVGKDLALMAGMCGSVSGSIPTTVGQPPIKVDEILVGGEV